MKATSKSLNRVVPLVKESEGSPIREMMKVMEERSDLINLSAGEANFEAPTELIELACQAMKNQGNRYTSTTGIPQVRRAIADFLHRTMQVEVDPQERMLLTVGGMEAIYLATRLLLNQGDEVLLPDPGWGIVRPMVARLGAKITFYPLAPSGGWTIEAGPILERIQETTKLIVINTPSNPTGATISRESYQAVLEAAERVGAFTLSDEVYHNYTYEGEHVSALGFDHSDKVIMINSFSKTFAVTGWRLGYVIAHPWLIRQMGVYKETISLCSSSIGQWAMASYLPGCEAYLEQARSLCFENMKKILSFLSSKGIECPRPKGGIYLFPDFSRIEPSSEKLFHRFLDAGLALVPGSFFGTQGQGHARIMFATPSSTIDQSLERMDTVLSG